MIIIQLFILWLYIHKKKVPVVVMMEIFLPNINKIVVQIKCIGLDKILILMDIFKLQEIRELKILLKHCLIKWEVKYNFGMFLSGVMFILV
jgi:hypothetical protein